ncbi:invasion associated locus B family protein [Mesorhizobium sp. SP-1A]|uniref:invasion associated locus B family protein n=1 Tax=Mesorhizobium sp. SP-1A TaxID=3077840 RepID=UPI0028F6C4DB|nr:invasion associated locus B family protein [Mesorhizobium sp. SP-1A]
MRKQVNSPLIPLVCLLLSGAPAHSAGQEPPSFHVKKSEVVLPEGVKPGQYRRMIQPFTNWTLICDEDLKAKKRVCNISQIIVDASDRTVFSWSLAATEEGKPYLIVRTPADADTNADLSFGFAGGSASVKLAFEGCNQSVCIGKLPVGPILRGEIAKESDVRITYQSRNSGRMDVTAPLAGLKAALAAIK